MRGFFDKDGQYYEADGPKTVDDREVSMRPSPAYVMSPEGQWIIDRRQLDAITSNNQRGANPAYQHGHHPHNGHNGHGYDYGPAHAPMYPPPMYPPAPACPTPAPATHAEDEQKIVRNTLFDFVGKNWYMLGTLIAGLVGMYVTFSERIHDMVLREQQLEQRTKVLEDDAKKNAEVYSGKFDKVNDHLKELDYMVMTPPKK